MAHIRQLIDDVTNVTHRRNKRRATIDDAFSGIVDFGKLA
jgi:hypothetical protein